MKSKFLKYLILLFIKIILVNINYSNAAEQFTFDITEIEITQNNNLIIGSKGGKAETEDGYEIIAENFVYNKANNILNVSGNVKLEPVIILFSFMALELPSVKTISSFLR